MNSLELGLYCAFCLGSLFIITACSLDIRTVQEGSCRAFKPAKNIDTKWGRKAKPSYVAAGSKYHLYRVAAGYPDFKRLGEAEFRDRSCLKIIVNETGVNAKAYGFGEKTVARYNIRQVQLGVYDFNPRPPFPGAGDISRLVVTLTDNENFIFFAGCWRRSKQRSWDVVVTKPEAMTREIRKTIEDHAVSLGFDRKQFMFLNFNRCERINMFES